MLAITFRAILLTSCLGAVLTLLLLLFKPITQKYFNAGWHYYIWLVVLVVMMMPVRVQMPSIEDIPFISGLESWIRDVFDLREAPMRIVHTSWVDELGHRRYSLDRYREIVLKIEAENQLNRMTPVWFRVAMLLMTLRVSCYAMFLVKIHRTTRRVSCPELTAYTLRNVAVRCGEWVTSPQLLGVFRPILLLPEREISQEQLHNILAHEMTHLRRQDMLYRWFVVLAKCVHWFNPFVYLLDRQVEQECEVSCDIAVTGRMNKEEKLSYVDTILAFLAVKRQNEIFLTMGMAGYKGMLKKRFLRMKKGSPAGRKAQICSVAIAAAFLFVAEMMSGTLAIKVMPYTDVHQVSTCLSVCAVCNKTTVYTDEREYLRFARTENNKNGHVQVYDQYKISYFDCSGCGYTWQEDAITSVQYNLSTVVDAGGHEYQMLMKQK